MLRRVQRGLERLYRIESAPDVRRFVVDEPTVAGPREQLLVRQDGDALEIGLFVDRAALANLARRDPRHGLGADNLEDLLLVVEGVSHYLYVVFRARAGHPVSALELELQAEVDKYLTCLLLLHDHGAHPDHAVRWRDAFALREGLSDLERARYRRADELARRYVAALQARFVADRRFRELLAEARRFYRLGLDAKERRIDALAA